METFGESLSYKEVLKYYLDKPRRIKEAASLKLSLDYDLPLGLVRKDLGLEDGDLGFKTFPQAFESYLKRLAKGEYRLGFKSLDSFIEGLKAGEFIVVAGRAGVGKTAFLQSLVKRMSKFKILFISLELPAERLFERFAASYLDTDLKYIREELKLGVGEKKFIRMFRDFENILIYDNAVLNLSDLDMVVAQVEDFLDSKLDVVFIDYLGLIRVRGNLTPYERMSRISKEVTSFAKRQDVLVIAASQCSRAAEGRPIEKSHLRGSGELEEDADVILGLWRDLESEREELSQRDSVSLIQVYLRILKNRNGIAGKELSFYFHPYTFDFSEEPFDV